MAKSLHRTATAATARLMVQLQRRDPWPTLLARALGTEESVLIRLSALMCQERLPLDLERMFLDTTYACQRLALAHTSTHEPLRGMAMGLFDAVQRLASRRDAWVRATRLSTPR